MDHLARVCLSLLALSSPLLAQVADLHLDITAQRKLHEDTSRKKTTVDMNKGDDDCVYDIVVTNNSLKDTQPLTVKYVIFVQRERLGEKVGVEHPTRVEGSEAVAALKTREKGTVATKSFSLAKSNLKDGWSYQNGGRATAKDSVKGIWARVFQGDAMVGEYANPAAIKTREKFEKEKLPE